MWNRNDVTFFAFGPGFKTFGLMTGPLWVVECSYFIGCLKNQVCELKNPTIMPQHFPPTHWTHKLTDVLKPWKIQGNKNNMLLQHGQMVCFFFLMLVVHILAVLGARVRQCAWVSVVGRGMCKPTYHWLWFMFEKLPVYWDHMCCFCCPFLA